MKTNFKRIGKQSISIVLAVMMMLSTMLVGMVTSNAANEFNKRYLYVDISDYSGTLDGVNTSYEYNCSNFNGQSITNWLQVANSKHCENVSVGVYKFDLSQSSDNYTFFRGFQVVHSGGPKKIGVVDGSTNNCIKVNGSGELSWTTYTESTTEHTVTANFSNATVKLGDKTLTSGTAVTVANDKSYTLTVEPNSGYSLSKVMQGSNDLGTSGNYTLAAGTDDVTIDITTENNTFDPSNTVYLRVNTNTYPEKFRVHIWKNSDKIAEWANSPYMTEVADEGNGIKVFAYTPDSGKYLKDYNSIIFRCNNGTGNYNNYTDGNFTGDITGVTLQGKIYDSTSTAPNKWSDYTVQTKYNVNIASDTTKGTVTTTPTSLAAGETFKVTAKPNDGYVLDTVTVKNESNNDIIPPNTDGTYTMPASNVTVTVTFKVADPVPVTLYATLVEGGAAYISSYTDNETGEEVTDATGVKNLQTVKAKPNTPVTFMAKEVNGYFPMWNVNSIKSTGATFTLDASYVTGTTGVAVYLTYEKIVNHNLTITSGEGGSVSYTYDETTGKVPTGNTSSAISVASNKTIKLTANADSANSYVFKGWEFDSDAISYVSGDSVSATITISVVGDVKVTATFEKRQGTLSDWKFMLSTSDSGLPQDSQGTCQKPYTVYQKADGTYSVTFPVSEIKPNTPQFFTFSTTGKNDGFVPGDASLKVETADNFSKYVTYAEPTSWGGKHFVKAEFKNTDDITNINVTYNSKTKTYIINGTYYTVPSDAHTVYATKGNTRSDGSMQYGTTTISLFGDGKIYKTKDNGSYNEYVVGDGNQITVECKVTDAQAKLGYYVYAFVVNGAKVDVIDTGNNVYQTTAPITVSSDLEITPVYYNKQIEADGNYVTIYTNAPKELQDSWGNSISIYSWYDNNGAEMNGSYPGQLMMRDSQGKFGAKVPKYSYYEDPNGKYVPNTTQKVLGITNNNYSEFQVVHTKFLTTPETQKNHQTYDYDDFEKLTGMGYDTVQFDIKYFPTATDSNQHLLVNDVTDQPSKPNFINKTATPYENLTNIDGKLVSILGYTNETAKAKNHTGLITAEPLQIISVGNQSVKIGEKTTNEWSTIWYVYDSKGNYITQGLPSDFIPRGEFVNNKFVESKNQTDAYKAIKDKNLEYNSAVISYEKEMDATTSTSGRNTGWRIDGRWYYARSVDQVDVNVGIIYRNNNGDKWTVDKPTETSEITGKVTGGSASFDYTDSVGSSHTNLASASVERNTIITLNATNGTQYKFIGWATPTYDADGRVTGYTPLNLTDLNATYSVSTNTELYAMYEPYATGSVTITHSKYTGLDSHNGLGIFFVTAKVFDANGKPVDSQAVATQSDAGSVTLENIVNKNDGSYIEVTLYTQSYAKSHFLNFYYPSVSNGVSTLTKEPNGEYYDKECPADARATQTFRVNVSDLFVNDKQTVMALNYYSDLKLPEVESNITFNYSPYSTAPNPNPVAGKGTGKTTFTLTITKNGETDPVFTTTGDLSSLTLKANGNIKSIIEDYVASAANGTDYTISIKLNPVEDNHCVVGKSYYQQNDSGSYTYNEIGTTVDIKLSEIYDIPNNKFHTNTINLYTDFTADVFNYNVTFEYLGYESREYYNNNGFTQEQIPESAINQNWWKNYTVNGTFYGSDIDKYFDYVDGQYKFKESFLLKVAPYEDNFVQSITWDLNNVVYSTTNAMLSVTATVPAKYDNGFVTVTADLGDGKPKQTYSVNYASLVTPKNLVGSTTQSANDEDYLIVAPETNAGKKFSYWKIQTDDSNGIEVAKCYTREFNFLAYDNYLITACYGKEDVDASKKGVSATMQFLEYSRNQYDTGKDRVYADFAVAYNYEHLLLQKSNNPDIVCGVAFVLNSSYKSDGNAVDTTFTVDSDALYEKVKDLNDKTTTDKKLADGSKVFNYVINKSSLDNKNRIEYNWSVDNLSANQQLTLLAYSYIYDKSTGKYSVSAPQSFKFYEVGNKSYEA